MNRHVPNAVAAPMREEFETVTDMELGAFYAPEVPMGFWVDSEEASVEGHPDHPTSQTELLATAELIWVQLGGLRLTREQVLQALSEEGQDGPARLAAIERTAAETYLTELGG